MDERPLVDTGKEIYQISGRSIEAGLHRPGHKQACSVDAGWQSVLLQTFTQPGTVEAFETTASPDHLFVFCLEGDYRIESFACGRWNSAQYRPGLGGYTSPMVGNRLRWYSRRADELRVVRLYIPDAYFQEAGEELRPAGKPPGRLPDSLVLPAPTAFGIATSLLQQMALGAPDLYADAAARVIAANLLVSHRLGQAPLRLEQPRASKTDRRLQRASDFLHEHYRQEVTLNRLAREAGMSAFHLSREYKALFGYTPHRHQICLRLQHARELLLRTDLSVQEITLECGYSHGGHFAAAFRTEFAVEPLAFRIKARRKGDSAIPKAVDQSRQGRVQVFGRSSSHKSNHVRFRTRRSPADSGARPQLQRVEEIRLSPEPFLRKPKSPHSRLQPELPEVRECAAKQDRPSWSPQALTEADRR